MDNSIQPTPETQSTTSTPVESSNTSSGRSRKKHLSENIFLLVIVLIVFLISFIPFWIYLALNSQQKPQTPQNVVPPQLSPSPTPYETTNWETYRNEEFGFEVRYPAKLEKHVDDSSIIQGDKLFRYLIVEESNSGTTGPSLVTEGIIIQVFEKKERSLEMFFTDNKKEFFSVAGLSTLQRTEGERSLVVMNSERTIADANGVGIFAADKYIVTISSVNNLEDYVFQQILSTFKFIDESEISWESAVELIRNCQVTMVAQTHSRNVGLTLKDGTSRSTIEPAIDMVLEEAQSASSKCGFNIDMVTE